MRPNAKHDDACQEDGLDLSPDMRDQVLTVRKRVGSEKEQEGIRRHIVLAGPEIAELHDQEEHDDGQAYKSHEGESSRSGSGRF